MRRKALLSALLTLVLAFVLAFGVAADLLPQLPGSDLPAVSAPAELLVAAKKTAKPTQTPRPAATPAPGAQEGPIIEPQAIADYIFAHGRLPDNFITKKEAQALGWDSSRNYVSDAAPGKSIGGDRFGNYEGLLPTAKGRQYYEADCYYTGGKRNAYRVIYSNDGLVYYTADHYQTFTQLFPSPSAVTEAPAAQAGVSPVPDGPIIDPQSIADYIFANGCLPDNFITKKEAQALGWQNGKKYVSDAAPGKSIGGDRFGNYEGLLPTAKGRQYYEADCYYVKGSRNAYRIIYSNDGLVYYTDDHYVTFTQMFPSSVQTLAPSAAPGGR